MARKPWVLDTETKGTGAQMVPLERLQQKSASKPVRPAIAPKPKPRPEPVPAPRGPWKFKVTDVMTQQVLTEDADLRATLDVLQGVRSIVDVRVYAWEHESEEWRPLPFGQKKLLWESRDR